MKKGQKRAGPRTSARSAEETRELGERWVSLAQLARDTGLALRTLQYLRKQEPGVLMERARAGRAEYAVGACNANLRRRERERSKREASPLEVSIAEAERRKALADARLAELKLAQLERSVVPIEEHVCEIENLLLHLRSALLAHPKTRGVARKILDDLRQRAPPPIEDDA